MDTTYQYFIFDLDGTLANTLGDLCSSMNGMLRYFGWREITEEDILANINRGVRWLVQGCMPAEFREDEALVEAAVAQYSECYAKEYLTTTHLYEGVAEGVAYLKAHGAKMGVFSNKQDVQTKAICEKLFPADTFEIVLGNNGVFPHKPSPEGALYVAEVLGARPEEIVFVGDSDVDMKTAANAGMHPVGVAWGYRSKEMLLSLGAETILSSLEDIQNLI